MFDFSFTELVVVALIGIVVVGPRQLPELLRTAGKWVGKLQRMAFDMRNQSGIDKILEDESLVDDIRQLSRLLRRRNVFEALSIDEDLDLSDLSTLRDAHRARRKTKVVGADSSNDTNTGDANWKNESREYPEDGCDSYGATGEREDPYQQLQADEHQQQPHGIIDESESVDGSEQRHATATELKDGERNTAPTEKTDPGDGGTGQSQGRREEVRR